MLSSPTRSRRRRGFVGGPVCRPLLLLCWFRGLVVAGALSTSDHQKTLHASRSRGLAHAAQHQTESRGHTRFAADVAGSWNGVGASNSPRCLPS